MASREITVYAFEDLPVRITWITPAGKVLKRQTVRYDDPPLQEAPRAQATPDS